MASILIAEDNHELRALLVESLTDAGHQVSECADGQGAIRLMQSQPFDVVVSDVLMPEADGAEVMRALRELDTRRPRLVMMSGGGRIDPGSYLRMAKALGADEVMQKPFPPSRLIEVVERLLQNRPAVPG